MRALPPAPGDAPGFGLATPYRMQYDYRDPSTSSNSSMACAESD